MPWRRSRKQRAQNTDLRAINPEDIRNLKQHQFEEKSDKLISEIILSVDNKGSKAFKNLLNRPNKLSIS